MAVNLETKWLTIKLLPMIYSFLSPSKLFPSLRPRDSVLFYTRLQTTSEESRSVEFQVKSAVRQDSLQI